MTTRRVASLVAALAGLAQTAAAQCPPNTPTQFFATQGLSCGSVFIDWQAVSGATFYTVWRNTTTSYASASLVGTSLDTQMSDPGASAGIRYYYWVTATRSICLPGSATGSPAGPVQGWAAQDPVAPTSVAASDGTYCGAVRVSWNQSTPLGGDVTDYTIYRNTTNLYLTSSSVGTTGGTAREFFDSTAAPATTYYYWVRAENDCGTAASDGDSGYISNLPPPANNTCSSASTAVSGGTYVGSTTCATRDGFASCGAASQGPDVWYRFVAPSNGTLHADTCGVSGSFNTVLSFHLNSCPGVTANLFACNNDGCGALSTLDAPVSGGNTYLIRVGGYSTNDFGNYELHVSFTPAGTPCYPNCDNSTIAPVLNVNDFSCFLNRYAAGNSYANCDASTIAPVLNVNDFTCFVNRYAVGCP